ncbi:type VI secretion system baseplate subunit TssF [Spirosoma sp. BT702]|uniref:Type VI secretion system baseplate subunit TssF n=1 Tax=Spirosoma profusum TaxID=2771354 RepID=A0A926XWA2_9BACT|nr:type VI secretion system baseplate subunit TssF [Spirosoma profusum]MBD2701056.1 type VI secretion system baseplate subunit TssF [Spirosoma profusum]
MPSSNILSEGFTRDRVKSRMLRRAADLWGYAETDLDSFDPLVALLIEACAVEFERVAVEIGNTQTRLLDRLAQVLHPDPNVARPAFAVAQVRSVEPKSRVSTTTQLVHKRVSAGRADSGGASTGQEVYFSPIGAATLVDGTIRYVATNDTLFRIDEANQKVPLAQRQGAASIQSYQSLWLGLELNESVTSLEGVSFFFDWPTEAGQDGLQAILVGSTWQLAEQPLTLRTGSSRDQASTGQSLIDNEFNVMYKVEKQAAAAFDRHFITVEAAPSLQSLSGHRKPYPAVFGQWFSERDLKPMRDSIWWIELQLPYTISQEALSGVFCGINCFPVVNRRLHRITYRLQQNLNIIPLETDRCFLSIREVRTSQNRQLTSTPLGNLTDLDTDSYSVQYGVSRFDDRDARQALTNLLDLLRDESASFAALGEDFLSSVIRELNQALARLEAKVDQKTRKRDSIPYLIIRPKQVGDTVFIEYWTCDGEAANRLPANSKLRPYADTSLRPESGFLVTPTVGGRERPKDSEKITQYKRSLLTRNRIVTPEDVKAVCQAELGTHLQSVRVERAFRVSASPTSGFERCIRVELQPSTGSNYSSVDWAQQARLLQLNLEAQSVSALPYQVIVENVK